MSAVSGGASRRLVSKLKASGIIPRDAHVLLKRRGTGGWHAVDLFTGEPLGVSSNIRMQDLLKPDRKLTVDSKGRVS